MNTDDRLADELRVALREAAPASITAHPNHFCLLRGGDLKSGSASDEDPAPEWCSDENCACHDEDLEATEAHP